MNNKKLRLLGLLGVLFASQAGAAIHTLPTFTTLDVPGASYASANDINDSGQVTGFYSGHSGAHGFLYSGAAFTTFDVPGMGTYPSGINNSGQVTGSYWDDSDGHSFVYSGGTFANFDVPGATSTFASGINDRGHLVGSYWDGFGTHGFITSIPPVPEPEEWAMMLVGIGLVRFQVRRKQANRLAC